MINILHSIGYAIVALLVAVVVLSNMTDEPNKYNREILLFSALTAVAVFCITL